MFTKLLKQTLLGGMIFWSGSALSQTSDSIESQIETLESLVALQQAQIRQLLERTEKKIFIGTLDSDLVKDSNNIQDFGTDLEVGQVYRLCFHLKFFRHKNGDGGGVHFQNGDDHILSVDTFGNTSQGSCRIFKAKSVELKAHTGGVSSHDVVQAGSRVTIEEVNDDLGMMFK